MFKGFRGTNNGSFDFSKDVNNPYNTNYAYATAILGYFRTYTESSSRPGPDMRSWLGEFYLQDNWRVTKKLPWTMACASALTFRCGHRI